MSFRIHQRDGIWIAGFERVVIQHQRVHALLSQPGDGLIGIGAVVEADQQRGLILVVKALRLFQIQTIVINLTIWQGPHRRDAGGLAQAPQENRRRGDAISVVIPEDQNPLPVPNGGR